MAGKARIACWVFSPDGVADEAGTPFCVVPSPLPCLMLHGNGEDHTSFASLVDEVSRTRTVIAPDSRAQGESTHGELPITYELMAEDALCVLSRLGVSQAHVLGFSDGGIEGLVMASGSPHRVRTLTCLGANLTPDGLIEPVRRAIAHEATLCSDTDAELARLMLEQPRLGHETLEAISCPVGVMAGEHDVVERGETETIAGGIGGSTLDVVADAGHDLPHEAPDRVLEVLERTMERDDPRPTAFRACDVPTDVSVVQVPATSVWAESLIGLYGELLDAAGDTGSDHDGWRRGAWPLATDIVDRVAQGHVWAAFGASDVEAGRPREGALPLGAMTLDHDPAIDEDIVGDPPSWDDLPPESVLMLHLLAVAPRARGRHVALALMAACVREARRQGSTRVRLNTNPENVAANDLYRRCGMRLARPVLVPYPGLTVTPWTGLYELDATRATF
ncbi:MAG: bifunctional alpha/beta hydrolase/GNAT family N-acetyltransferase [Atopobiaceae bacterium]|nr:alpha/beta fold hydrolase [Atopobiaceae bacterium]MCH4181013.1 alpha/beta fold hydrolase [Atopobiaceae bacterium]MCH4214925.1 alpha/beta fold hydrolase [Atopobiaceae bacterium]MCH4229747.1 alpha/beta fold hydrolase [Atopobiaceae bacterium]MCH4276056.1 alpha/beta fold hydrolase [Atopobiaceae bacterium]